MGLSPRDGPAALPVETLLAKARAARPAQPATITLRSNPAAPAEVGYGREGALFLNPYTGEVLGEGSRRARAFFQGVTDWHHWLGAGGERRSLGRAITGACNLVFLFIVASGFYLWRPRKWTRAGLRSVTWFRRGLGGKARDFNWHNVVGFWSAAPLFVVVISAVVISYTWASNLVYRAAGEQPPAARPQRQPAQGGNAGGGPQPKLALEGLDRLWARAAQQQAGWRSISLRLPTAADQTATFTIDQGAAASRRSARSSRSTGIRAKCRSGSLFRATRSAVGCAPTCASRTRAKSSASPGRPSRASPRRAARRSSGRDSRWRGVAGARGPVNVRRTRRKLSPVQTRYESPLRATCGLTPLLLTANSPLFGRQPSRP